MREAPAAAAEPLETVVKRAQRQVAARVSGNSAPEPVSSWLLSCLLVLISLILFFPLPGPASAWQSTFSAYFISIVLQSIPYMLLGALISGVMEQLLPSSLLPALVRRLGPLGLPAIALLAPIFPTCECGVVSIGRSLLRKGLPVPHTLTYLLAAPILNPTVLFTTWLAFRDWRYPLLRAAGGLLVALAVGLVFSRLRSAQVLLAGIAPLSDADGANTPGGAISFSGGLTLRRLQAPRRLSEAFSSTEAGAAVSPAVQVHSSRRGLASRLRQLGQHVSHDFLEMSSFFLLGVFIASLLKTFIPSAFLTSLGAGPVSGPLVMGTLALVLSLCAEADAYPAASFVQFSLPAHMAFLVLGPMLDIKLLLMYRGIFRGRFILLFAGAILIGVAAFVALLGWLK